MRQNSESSEVPSTASARRIPYYQVKRGHGYWNPTRRMKLAGFSSVSCGLDGPEARDVATTWNARWQLERKRGGGQVGEHGYVYFLKVGNRIKIGFSKNPLKRAGDLATAFGNKVGMLIAVPGRRADEQRLHSRFVTHRVHREWFAATDPIKRFAMRSAMLERIVHDDYGDRTMTAPLKNRSSVHRELDHAYPVDTCSGLC